jgi:uncharacterized protein
VKINFTELELLKGEAKKIHFTFPYPEVAEENREVLTLSPVEFDGEAKYAAGLVEVNGTCSFTAQFICSRCLGHFTKSFLEPFNEFFARDRANEKEDDGDQDEIHWVEENPFDLVPYCKEVIFLALPYIPICDEECKGLCPSCGNNLNEKICGCKEERIDPRLAELAKLLNQDES